jgi:hypothetical protein
MYLQEKHLPTGNVCVYFGCRGAYLRFTPCTTARRFMTATQVERTVRLQLAASLAGIVSLDDAIAQATDRAGGDKVQSERTDLIRRRTALQAQRERAEHLYTTGRRSLTWFDTQDARIQLALAAVSSSLQNLPQWPERDRFADAREQLTSLAVVIAIADGASIRAFLMATGAEVWVGPDGIRITYAHPWADLLGCHPR